LGIAAPVLKLTLGQYSSPNLLTPLLPYHPPFLTLRRRGPSPTARATTLPLSWLPHISRSYFPFSSLINSNPPTLYFPVHPSLRKALNPKPILGPNSFTSLSGSHTNKKHTHTLSSSIPKNHCYTLTEGFTTSSNASLSKRKTITTCWPHEFIRFELLVINHRITLISINPWLSDQQLIVGKDDLIEERFDIALILRNRDDSGFSIPRPTFSSLSSNGPRSSNPLYL
jgi:hypothetical protein